LFSLKFRYFLLNDAHFTKKPANDEQSLLN
jgi:hypothetical protein